MSLESTMKADSFQVVEVVQEYLLSWIGFLQRQQFKVG